MKTDQHRADAYDAGTNPATVGLKVAARLTGMKAWFATAAASLVPMEMSVQTVLNDDDVPTIHYPFYLSFAREIWAMQYRGVDGNTIISMAQSLHDKWVSMGLATATLVRIADEVFHITVT